VGELDPVFVPLTGDEHRALEQLYTECQDASFRSHVSAGRTTWSYDPETESGQLRINPRWFAAPVLEMAGWWSRSDPEVYAGLTSVRTKVLAARAQWYQDHPNN
jgi:hypothetical protein